MVHIQVPLSKSARSLQSSLPLVVASLAILKWIDNKIMKTLNRHEKICLTVYII